MTTGIGLKELCDAFRAKHDDYNAIMAEALADRLAEAFAEYLHKRVREDWGYGKTRTSPPTSSSPRSTAASAPPPATPRAPTTPRRGRSGRSSTSRRTPACGLTESFAMWPGSSVSGLYFAHPEARYFTLGKIDRDQVVDYRGRKGMTTQRSSAGWPQPRLRTVELTRWVFGIQELEKARYFAKCM